MKNKTSNNAAPADWIEGLKASDEDIEAGRLVDLEDVLAEGDKIIAQIEARRKNQSKSEVA